MGKAQRVVLLDDTLAQVEFDKFLAVVNVWSTVHGRGERGKIRIVAEGSIEGPVEPIALTFIGDGVGQTDVALVMASRGRHYEGTVLAIDGVEVVGNAVDGLYAHVYSVLLNIRQREKAHLNKVVQNGQFNITLRRAAVGLPFIRGAGTADGQNAVGAGGYCLVNDKAGTEPLRLISLEALLTLPEHLHQLVVEVVKAYAYLQR